MTTDFWDPIADLDAAAALGGALRDVGYTEKSIEQRLGEDGTAADQADAVVFARRLQEDELGDAIRGLLLLQPVERRRLPRAIVEGLTALGLAVDVGGAIVPRGRIVPTEGTYLAFDGFSQGLADPPGWVAAFTP